MCLKKLVILFSQTFILKSNVYGAVKCEMRERVELFSKYSIVYPRFLILKYIILVISTIKLTAG